jgi:uncharacterized protein (DUF4213/DUF364 family)
MHLRELLAASVREKCAAELTVKVDRFIKPPECETGGSSFSVVTLDNGSIGISYNLFHRYTDEFERYRRWDTGQVAGKQAGDVLGLFLSGDSLERTAGLAVLNALSQDYIRKHPGEYCLDFETDVMDLAGLDKSCTVGLVGFFSPMISSLMARAKKVIVLEKDEGLLAGSYPFTMTGDPADLRACDSVFITATTVLNDSLEGLLGYCTGSRATVVMGPTAGFLPDVLFDLKVYAVGGTWIDDPRLFVQRFESGIKWGDSTRKVWFLRTD